jgi:NAD(P)-dependent dehydrogenase (short-subunit alcohol dehydrogenase family)
LINTGGAILNVSPSVGAIATLLKRSGFSKAAGSDRESRVYLYSARKSALNNLTVRWAMEEQKKGSGIRVVAISPGMCMSQLGGHLSFVYLTHGPGYNATHRNNYTGTMLPAEGCKVIVKAALETEGRTAVFFGKDRAVPW